jgi:hypothetical protein
MSTKAKKATDEQAYDDRRRLRVLPGWTFDDHSHMTSWAKEGDDPRYLCVVRLFKYAGWHVIAWHADRSFTQHTSLLAAHNALVASGSPSPFEVLTGRIRPPRESAPPIIRLTLPTDDHLDPWANDKDDDDDDSDCPY